MGQGARADQFRHDINGLRAIAVVAVLFFHFRIPGFSGGFAGVDVFFVVSGYLMASIIFGGIDSGTFSLLDFYLSRGRRIIPALAVVCMAAATAGWFFLVPFDFSQLAKSVLTSITFVSNFLYWKDSGYFSAGADQNWLLHTWSLSVEWQFYMVFPVVVLVSRRFLSRAAASHVLIVLLASSFALSCYFATHYPTADFYLLPSRAWELLMGGIVFLYPPNPSAPVARILEIVGLLLILATFWFVDRTSIWPGWTASAPVIGTALVVAAGRSGSPIMSNPLSWWIGRNSYSIYLWHWPLIVGLRYFGFFDNWWWKTAAIALSLALGWLSFAFIEKRGRRLWRVAKPEDRFEYRHYLAALLRMATGPAMIAIVGFAIWAENGLPQRFDSAVALADAGATDIDWRWRHCFGLSGSPPPSCTIGGNGRNVAAELIGDSYAGSVATALASALPRNATGGIFYHAYASCPTIENAVPDDPENHCQEFNREYLEPILTRFPSAIPIIVANYWYGYILHGGIRFSPRQRNGDTALSVFSVAAYGKNLEDTLCAISRKRPAFVMLPLPSFAASVPQTLARALIRNPNAPDISMPIRDYERQHAMDIRLIRNIASHCRIHLLDPIRYLCPNGICMGSAHHRSLYADDIHLNNFGSHFLVPMFRPVLATSRAVAADDGAAAISEP